MDFVANRINITFTGDVGEDEEGSFVKKCRFHDQKKVLIEQVGRIKQNNEKIVFQIS